MRSDILDVYDLRFFVPAQDFALSKAFYMELGWTELWSDANLALLENGSQRFYLQNFYAKEFAENFMIHLSVADAAAWHARMSALIAGGRFPGVRVSSPKPEPYGALVTYAWDPSGVLLHFAQWANAR